MLQTIWVQAYYGVREIKEPACVRAAAGEPGVACGEENGTAGGVATIGDPVGNLRTGRTNITCTGDCGRVDVCM